MKKFWKWKNQTVTNQETQEQTLERTLFLNGTIAEESWFDDDVTPKLFRDELFAEKGDITIWINSPGGDCVAASQIYNMMMEYPGNVTVKVMVSQPLLHPSSLWQVQRCWYLRYPCS